MYMYIHSIHHHNDIININIISFQCHYHHQHYLISISSLTLTSSHLNIIININIISHKHYHKQQHHLISSSTSPHIIIIINIYIISYHYYQKHQHHFISMLSMSPLIAFHIYTYKFLCLGFTLPKSSDKTNLIQQRYHSQFLSSITINYIPLVKNTVFLENRHATGTDIHHYSWVP